jgi:hypothetical protein
VLLALYVFSIGPILRYRPLPNARWGIETASAPGYGPLFSLARHPIPGKALAWYISLWLSDDSADYDEADHRILLVTNVQFFPGPPTIQTGNQQESNAP